MGNLHLTQAEKFEKAVRIRKLVSDLNEAINDYTNGAIARTVNLYQPHENNSATYIHFKDVKGCFAELQVNIEEKVKY